MVGEWLTGAPQSPVTSLTLLERIKANDPIAWERLVAVYGPTVYAWCRRRLQSADAADVSEEVFCTVFKSVHQFRHDRSGDTFAGWLWTITRSRINDCLRAHAKRAHAIGGTAAAECWEEIPEEVSAGEDSPDSCLQPASPVRRALEFIHGEFRANTWSAFWRATVDGHAVNDIAEDLGISPNAVRKAKSRVLCRLREEFGELLP